MNHIELIAGGRSWNGSFMTIEGSVYVSSAYGGERAPVERAEDAKVVALALLEKIVKRWSPAMKRARFRPGRPYTARW